jgi:hypothetical protein
VVPDLLEPRERRPDPPRAPRQRIPRGLLWMSILTIGLAACAPAASAAVTAEQAIGWLNAQRAVNDLPAGISDDAEWNEGCRLHMQWYAKNPKASNPHIETPGTAGYTTLGAFAGAHAVLAAGTDWTGSRSYPWDAADPWEFAPIHLMQLLAPELSLSGFAPTCMITSGGYERTPPAEPELLTYPGNGTSFIYPAEQANEWPFTPAPFVGLKQGATTGPYLYVLGWGTSSGRLTSASLTGPSGAVQVRTVDNSTTGPLGDLGSYMPPGGMLIPLKALAPGKRYTATATFAPSPAVIEVPPAAAEPGVISFPSYEVTGNLQELSPGESQTAPPALSVTWSFRTAAAPRRPAKCRRGRTRSRSCRSTEK